MELFLNLAWLLLAGAMIGLWLQREKRAKTGYGQQLIAIAVVIAILFPVISLSDDLLTAQNVFEADNYQRRDHLVQFKNPPIQPALTILAALVFASTGQGVSTSPLPSPVPICALNHLAPACVGNLPPPSA